jgi:hypothetical protein
LMSNKSGDRLARMQKPLIILPPFQEIRRSCFAYFFFNQDLL